MNLTHRTSVSLLATGILAMSLTGCTSRSASTASNTERTVTTASAQKFQATLTRYDATLPAATPAVLAAVARAVGLALQHAGVTRFTYDTTAKGLLTVQVNDPLTSTERTKLANVIQLARDATTSHGKPGPKITGVTVPGWRFELAGPSPVGDKPGQVDPKTAQNIADQLSALLPNGFQTLPDRTSVGVIYAGTLPNGAPDIEKARQALARALHAPNATVQALIVP